LSPGVLQGAFCFCGDRGAVVNMPKMKTHKSSVKRFRVSATGKLKRRQAGKKHLNSHKPTKRKRHLRGIVVETGRLGSKYVKMMGEVK
jgi:large subunit ribosomal protein L35